MVEKGKFSLTLEMPWVVIITLAHKKDQRILKLVGESLMRKSDMHLQEIYTEALKSNGVSCL